MQSLVDLRREPRWSPDWAVGSQIKADFLGRLIGIARKYVGALEGSPLYELVMGSAPSSVMSQVKFPYAYLPGPLEGAAPSLNTIPPDIAQSIEAQAKEQKVGPGSFIVLVNSALIFQLQSDHAELAAKALKEGSHRLANVSDRDQLVTILDGLATVAAVTRNPTLAREITILLRRYRRDPQYSITLDESLKFGLIAAAAFQDKEEWRAYAGEWIVELSFSDMTPEDGINLQARLNWLLNAAPELWFTCGRAHAAVTAFTNISAAS
jgi:hypothetical protein